MSTSAPPLGEELAPPTRKVRGGRRHIARAVVALQLSPLMLFLLVFLVGPLGVFALYSFWATKNYEIVADWSFANYTSIFTEEAYRSLLVNTISIAGRASLVVVIIAYGFAHAIRFHLRRGQQVLLLAVLIAGFSGYLVRIYSWRTILGSRGMINESLMQLGIIERPFDFLLYSPTASITVLANFLLPTAVLPIWAALQSVEDDKIEAARDLGCSAFQTWRRVVLPLAFPGIFGAFALSFVIAAGDYATPQLVGGTSGTMIGRAIADKFGITYDWPTGAALAYTTLIVVVAVVLVLRKLLGYVIR